MGMFTAISQGAFDELQLDAGMLLRTFNPASPAAPQDEDIITATTGGIQVSCVPTYSDFGEDVDNVPNNMKEFKHLDSWECKISTTALGTSPAVIKFALGAADVDGSNSAKIVPRRDLEQTDFAHLWWVGDKADGGMVAVKLLNALSTGGFSLQTTKNGKGTVALEIMGHVSINAQNVMPMEFYSTDGSGLKNIGVSSFESSTAGKTDITAGYTLASGQSFKYKLGSAPVSVELDDVLTTGWTAWNGSDAITATTGQYITIAAVTTADNKAKAVGSCMVTAKPAS